MSPRPSIPNAYQRALLRARSRGHVLGKRNVQRLNNQLRTMLKELATKDANPITHRRALDLRKQIVGILGEFERLTVSGTSEAVRITVTDTVKIHRNVVEKLVTAYRPKDAQQILKYNSLNVRALQALASREKNAALFKTLVRRNILEVAPDLDRVLISGVSRGVSISKLTKDVAGVLSGDFPSLQDYGMKKTDLSGMRTVLSDARRIARSEVNNAMREANRMAMAQSPIVAAAKWQLSGAHGDPDECDELAEADDYGFGPGFYPPDAWPLAPHPNCGCYAGEIRFRPVEEWATPKAA